MPINNESHNPAPENHTLHPRLAYFVKIQKITLELALSITQYESSLLADMGLDRLLEAGRMTAEEILQMTKAEYEASSLSAPAMSYLVCKGRVAVQTARAMSRSAFESSLLANYVIHKLVVDRRLSADILLEMTPETYVKSSISKSRMLHLIKEDRISGTKAIALTLEEYNQSALSTDDIYYAVLNGALDAESALSIPKEEVESPVEYLQRLPSRTSIQNKRLELHYAFPGIRSDFIERIIFLEQKENRLPVDDRTLNLLYMQHARTRADMIADLEFTAYLLESDKEKLEQLYLEVICKIPFKGTPRNIAEIMNKTLSLQIEDEYDEQQQTRLTCGLEFSQSTTEQSFDRTLIPDYHVAFFARANQNSVSKMKRYLDTRIKSELIHYYLDINLTATAIRNTDTMQQYIEEKTTVLRSGILRFFVESRAPVFSRDTLDALITTLREKISTRKLTLNDREKITDLHAFIFSEPQMNRHASLSVN